MSDSVSRCIWKVLTCSNCGSELEKTSDGAKCRTCNIRFHYSQSGALDLRLQKKKTYGIDFVLGHSPDGGAINCEPLAANTKPEVDFTGVNSPWHLSREIMSYFPKAKSPDSLMLDLGCGSAIHKPVCEHAGFEWVGLDYQSEKAPILGDAHSLPFKNDTFELILSIAVLEHIRFPFIMMREAHRVLKPHGCLIGTVAFLEPFHDNSFYHHTHLGLINSLQHGGFSIEKIAPNEKWSVLTAQASMELFPGMPGFLSRSIVFPIQFLHELWWQLGTLFKPNFNKHNRVRNTTGSFTFIATKLP